MPSSVTWARVTVLVENVTDMLLTDDDRRRIHRFGLIEHFRPPHGKVICTENGISYWIEAGDDEAPSRTILFDTGLTGIPLMHNVEALGLDLSRIDDVIISHAHPDHYGGLANVLEARRRQTRVIVHPDAFLKKVFLNDEGEPFLHVNAGFERQALVAAGATFVDARDPVEISAGVWATGQIPRNEPFEPPVPVRTGRAACFSSETANSSTTTTQSTTRPS
jgi:7,8-dihydropterin-6-yl-methyl-4-(beta-D-ribofuranosyl)aminobenzene 5'-phosphate synthase